MFNNVPAVAAPQPAAAAGCADVAPGGMVAQLTNVRQSSAVINRYSLPSPTFAGRPVIQINPVLLNFVRENWPRCQGRSRIDRVRNLLRLPIPYRPETAELHNALELVDPDAPLYHTVRSALLEFDQKLDPQVMAWVVQNLAHCTGNTYRDNIDILMMRHDKPDAATAHTLRPAFIALLGPEMHHDASGEASRNMIAERINPQVMLWASSNWSQSITANARQKLDALLARNDRPERLSLLTLYPVIKRLPGAGMLRKVDIRQAFIRSRFGVNEEVEQWTQTHWPRMPPGSITSKILAMLALPNQPGLLNPSLFYASLYRLLGVNCPCFSTVGEAFRLHKQTGDMTPEVLQWISANWRKTAGQGSQLMRILSLLHVESRIKLDEVLLFHALKQLEPEFSPSLMSIIYAFSLYQTRNQFTQEMYQWVMRYWPQSAGLTLNGRIERLLNSPGKPEELNSRLLFGVLMTTESVLPDWYTLRDAWVKLSSQNIALRRQPPFSFAE